MERWLSSLLQKVNYVNKLLQIIIDDQRINDFLN